MKGFVRLLEAVIASIILIASISYFFVPAAPQSSWDDTMAVIRARESLMSMEKSGRLADYVARNDVAAINADLRKSVPSNIEFSVEIRDIANGIIFVECFCTEAEKSSVESLLSPLRFNYNGRDIEIRVQQLANLNSINANTNVLLIIGYENLNAYRASLDSFLERGGTIFMLSSLYENQVNDGYMDSVFGLRWGDSGGGSGRFYDTTTPSKVSYKVANYYLALRKEDASAAAFSGFSGEGVNQVVVDDRSVVVSSPANVISYVKINQFIVNNRGRTVWFSDYDYGSNSPDAQQLKNLTKAALMWASGERYKMDPFRKSAGPVFSEAKLLSTSGSEHFEVSLLFWKIFF